MKVDFRKEGLRVRRMGGKCVTSKRWGIDARRYTVKKALDISVNKKIPLLFPSYYFYSFLLFYVAPLLFTLISSLLLFLLFLIPLLLLMLLSPSLFLVLLLSFLISPLPYYTLLSYFHQAV